MSTRTLELLRSLRTIHWDFNNKKVSKEDVEAIIEHSLNCANSDNVGDISVIVVDASKTLAAISGNESGGVEATCLIYCMDHTRIIKMAKVLGYDNFKPNTELYNS